MAAPRPGNPDRGWNDPPMFNYSPQNKIQSSPRGTKLNKRIAYTGGAVNTSSNQKVSGNLLNPDSGPPTSPVQLLPPLQLLPPTTNTTTTMPVPLLIPCLGSVVNPVVENTETSENESNLNISDMDELLSELNISNDNELFEKVKACIDIEFERCLPRLQGRSAEDIRRKLQILKENWKDKKLSEEVRVRIWTILKALGNAEYDKAWEIHLSLMVDYTAEVGQWLVAVKRIINEEREMAKESENQEQTEKRTDTEINSDTSRLIPISGDNTENETVQVTNIKNPESCCTENTGSSVDG